MHTTLDGNQMRQPVLQRLTMYQLFHIGFDQLHHVVQTLYALDHDTPFSDDDGLSDAENVHVLQKSQ